MRQMNVGLRKYRPPVVLTKASRENPSTTHSFKVLQKFLVYTELFTSLDLPIRSVRPAFVLHRGGEGVPQRWLEQKAIIGLLAVPAAASFFVAGQLVLTGDCSRTPDVARNRRH